MGVKKVNIKRVQGRKLSGRYIFDLVTKDTLGAKLLALEVTKVQPGQVVPCHAHQNSEEAAYVISGKGKVWVDSVITDLKEGDAILWPVGAKHTVKNTSDEELILVCAFSSPDYHNDYVFYENLNPFSE